MAIETEPTRTNRAAAPTDAWITLEVDPDRGTLGIQEARLQKAWPGRYESRIVAVYGDRAYALMVRHRDVDVAD